MSGDTPDAISRRELLDHAARGVGRMAGHLVGVDRYLRRWRRQLTLTQIPRLPDEALQRLIGPDATLADIDLYLAAANENLRRLERQWAIGQEQSRRQADPG